MKAQLQLAVLALFGLAATGRAQTPVADGFRSMEQRMAKNLVAAAEEMPADKYGYKPTPAQMSAGDIVGHLSEGNDYFCGTIGGVTAPKRAELPKTASKEQLIARLKETFQFCESALAKLDDSSLGAKVPFFGGRQVTRAEAMFVAVEDWGDHYSQFANYLRLNGLLPPTAKKS
jgi:uncharacterized damage-inducible protein DinB